MIITSERETISWSRNGVDRDLFNLVLGQASRGSYTSCETWLSNLSIKSTKVHLLKRMLNQHFKNVEPTFEKY